MIFRKKHAEQNDVCEIHGHGEKALNKSLLSIVLVSVVLVIWHVWAYGPVDPALSRRPFPVLLGNEIWDIIFGRKGILAELRDIFPYYLSGVLLAGLIRTYKLTVKLRSSLNRYGFFSVFVASLAGILTPLCACGTLTTAISLLFAGIPLAPVMSLLVTSPLMSPSAYLLTLNDLGPEWAVIRTVAAFLMGIFAGMVTHLVRGKGFQTSSIFIEGAIPRGDFHDENYPDKRLKCNCKEKFGNRVAARTSNKFLIFLAKSSEMLWLVGKYVLAGVAIGTVIERYMSYEWLYKLFDEGGRFSIIWITLGTIPIFLHQISASSILYHIKSGLDGTLSGGAGLAFMIGGPVTAIPTLTMFWTAFKKRVFFLYLFVCVLGTILIAYSFQYLVFVPGVDTDNPLLRGVSSVSGGNSPVINKTGKHVRAVMDPGGKTIIALYDNYIEGQGGVVFDAGAERFLGPQAGRYGNVQYAGNIAGWLEQNNDSDVKKDILIYVFGPSGADAFSRGAVSYLEKKGFKVELADRKETPVLSEGLLGKHSQLWIFFPGAQGGGGRFSQAELDAISGFSDDGKGMLLVPEGQQGADAANQAASGFGVTFSGLARNPEELTVSTSTYFFSRMSGAVGKVLKLVHKA
ncbi:MAG: permease [Nitrospiraceae bacterium]|nr:permease [Nitrospiraceae bacterium]